MNRFHQSSIAALLLVILAGCGDGGRHPTSRGPVDSDLGAFVNGGGCHPVGASLGGLPSPFDQAGEIVLVNPEWAPVIHGQTVDSDPVVIHGTVVKIHGDTGGDFPATHVRSDVVTTVRPDPANSWRLGTANLEDEEGAMEFEWEAGAYPDWAWAGEGDRIVGLGRWIFDCGHPDSIPGHCSATAARSCILDTDCRPPGCPSCGAEETCAGPHFRYTTEMHPPMATAVIRQGRGGIVSDEPGEPAVPATRTDIFASPNGGGAGDQCVLTHQSSIEDLLFRTNCYPLKKPVAFINFRDFRFDVPLPPRPAAGGEAAWRLIERTAPGRVKAEIDVRPHTEGADPHLEVRVKLAQPTSAGVLPNGVAATLFAGWKSASTALTHVRVTVEGLLVLNPLKPTTPVVREAKGWRMQVAVNGEWQELQDLDDVTGGGMFPQNLVFDEYLPPDGTFHIFANGTSEVCIDTMFGKSLADDVKELGVVDTIRCLLTTDAKRNPGQAEGGCTGGDFCAGEAGDVHTAIISQFGEGGTCSITQGTNCVTNEDCPSGESCTPTDGAFALLYRIQRLP